MPPLAHVNDADTPTTSCIRVRASHIPTLSQGPHGSSTCRLDYCLSCAGGSSSHPPALTYAGGSSSHTCTGGPSYAILGILVRDKPHVTVLLGAKVEQPPDATVKVGRMGHTYGDAQTLSMDQ